jgi:hypothetical protein
MESSYFDYKVYCLQSQLNQFVLTEISEIINILKFNPNILKLYIEEEFINQGDINDHLGVTLKIIKLSRTPAYGVKRIAVSNDIVTFYLKPCQVYIFFLSKPFADRFLNKQIKNPKLLSFLKILNYNEAFYIDNYEILIDKFYLLNNENVLKEDSYNKTNPEINLVKINGIDDLGYDLLFSKYFDIELNNFSGLFKNFDQEMNSLGYEVQFIIEKRNNIELYVIYNAHLASKEKRDQFKMSMDIIENIKILTFNKINQSNNKFIKMLFSDKEYKNEYIDITKLFSDLENVKTVKDLICQLVAIKELNYKTLEVKFQT